MKLTITSTKKIALLDGDPCRVWEGKTESGQDCIVLVRYVMFKNDHPDHSEFADLNEDTNPKPVFITDAPEGVSRK